MLSATLSPAEREQRIHRQKKAIMAVLDQVPANQHVSVLHRLRKDTLNRMNHAVEPHPSRNRYNEAVAQRIVMDEKGEIQKARKSRQTNLMILFFLSAAASLAHQYFLPANPSDTTGVPTEAFILLIIGLIGFLATLGFTGLEMRLRHRERENVKASLNNQSPESPDIVLEAIDSVLANQFS